MTKLFYLTAFFLCVNGLTFAQTTDALRQKIQQLISTKDATIGVSIMSADGKDTLSIHGDTHCPMMSVFKFHIAIVVLSQIDEGKFSLNQQIKIEKKDLLPKLYSPLRDKYPNGGSLPISEILRYTVSESDNVGCDILLKLIGGASVVEAYFLKNGCTDISIKHNEETQQANEALQFQNWISPKTATETLAKWYYNHPKLLSQQSYEFLWKIMKATTTGQNRLKKQLPKNTIVAHKTGTSGSDKAGTTIAINDIGIVFLPNGQHFFISVFVTNSKENTATNEKIIADISKVAWDYFVKK